MAKLSLICPAMGRSTTGAMIESVSHQLREGDELLIIGDGPLPELRELVKVHSELFPRVVYLELLDHVGDFGCTPCDFGIAHAQGDYVFFIGDDDLVAPDAIEIIHKYVDEQPDVPHLFAMVHSGRVLGPHLQCGNVSGQQIVVPRDMSKMPLMQDVHPEQRAVSDWIFIEKVHQAWGKSTVFHDEIIAILPRQNHGKML